MVMTVLVMLMAVVMIVMVPSAHWNRDAVGLTDTRAFPFAECTGFREPLYVVMVTGLIKSHFLLKAQDLSPVFAERAVHCGFSAHHFLNPLQERV